MSAPSEVIVADPPALGRCLEQLHHCPVIGLDTEFVGEDSYYPDLCLIQIATPNHLYLIDPLQLDDLQSFWSSLMTPERQVIVHAGREEIRVCQRHGGAVPKQLIDVQLAAGLLGLGYPLSHGALLQQVLQVRLSKGETLTDWRRRPLSSAQLRYAFDDVRYLLPLWQNLANRLEERLRLNWLTEEVATLTRQALAETSTTEKWRKLRGVGSLDRRRLAIVRRLFEWREQEAGRINRPVRGVLRDDLIVEIAKRNPTREDDLRSLRGLGDLDARRLVEQVRLARELPVEQCPSPQEREWDTPQIGLVSSFLSAVLVDWCSRNELTATLVASGQDLRGLVRATALNEPLSEQSPLMRGWRRQHVLPELQAVLEGRRWIRVQDLRRDFPLEMTDSNPT